MAALNALLSQPYWTGNSPNMSVDFRYSAFLERSDNGEIIVKHPSLSAVILIAITSRQSTVCGALNPAPNHKLKAQHLYNIPFAYLKDWPIEKNVARCEWTMGNTGSLSSLMRLFVRSEIRRFLPGWPWIEPPAEDRTRSGRLSRIAGQRSDTAAGLGNITKGQKEHTSIVVLEAGVGVMSCLVRVFERLQNTLATRVSANRYFSHLQTSRSYSA